MDLLCFLFYFFPDQSILENWIFTLNSRFSEGLRVLQRSSKVVSLIIIIIIQPLLEKYILHFAHCAVCRMKIKLRINILLEKYHWEGGGFVFLSYEEIFVRFFIIFISILLFTAIHYWNIFVA